MSESQGTEVVTPVITEPTEGTGHPAWQEALADVPEGLRPMISPALEKWDKGVEARLAKVREEYEPYKGFIDNQIDPDQATQALNFLRAIENDPAGVIKALQEAYGLTKAEAKEVVAAAGEELSPEAKRLAALEAQQEQLLAAINSRTQNETNAQQQQQLRTYLDGLKKTYPLVPEDIIIAHLANGNDGEAAAKLYMSHLDESMKAAQAPGNEAPVVLGGGGGVVSSQQDLTKLSEKDTKDLVAKMLAEAAAQT